MKKQLERKVEQIERRIAQKQVDPRVSNRLSQIATGVMKLNRLRRAEGMAYREVIIQRQENEERDIRLSIYQPKEAEKSQAKVPGLLWIHGGGYGIGVAQQGETFIRRFVEATGCTVVAPNYTLSTDQTYPASLYDCYAALLWMKENAHHLNVRTDQLMVGGDSAGGSLAISVSLLARDRQDVNIAFQMPLYPMLDDKRLRDDPESHHIPRWMARVSDMLWALYLGDLYGTENVPYYAAPSRLEDVSGLPPTYAYFGTVEPYYDGIVSFLDQLEVAGIPVSYDIYDWCFHALDILAPNTAMSKAAQTRLVDYFKYACTHCFAKQDEA